MIVATPPPVTRPATLTPESITKAANEDSFIRAIVAALVSPLLLVGSSLIELLRRGDADPSDVINWSFLRRRLRLALSGPLGDEARAGGRRAATDFSISFDLVSVRSVAAAEAHAGELAASISATARDAVRSVIVRAQREGRGVDYVAAEIRSVIGLHPRWARAVANRRRALEASGESPARVERLVAQYRSRLLDYQARMLARTELLRSNNLGAMEGYRQAVAVGALPPDFVRVWVTAPLEGPRGSRVCPICRPLNGQIVRGLEEKFETSVGPVLTPPAHFGCRCRLVARAS